MSNPRTLLAALLLLSGCPADNTRPTGPVADTVSPQGSPVQYKVFEDVMNTNANSVKYHVLVAETTKHDEVQKLLEYLYRYLKKRRDDEPAVVGAYVYSAESQYKIAPRSPIGSVVLKAGSLAPTFENRVPLEFWQEVAEAMAPTYDEKWKLARKVARDDNAKTLVLTYPYTEPGKDEWVDKLSFNQAMNAFTDTAQALFEKVPDLKAMTFVGTYKDKEVVRIDLSRTDYAAINLTDLGEKIGQHHGRAFLELATNRTNDAKADKDTAKRIADEYRAMLKQLQGKAKVDPTLK